MDADLPADVRIAYDPSSTPCPAVPSDGDDLDIANRTTCEFDAMCANSVESWTSLFGFFYPVCAEHLTEAISL